MNLDLYKKNKQHKEFVWHNWKIKCLLLFTLMCFQTYVKCQAQTVTLDEKNAKFEAVLLKIRTQTGFDIIADQTMLQNAKTVTISATKKDVNLVLEELAKGQDFTIVVSNKSIIIKPLSTNQKLPKTTPTVPIQDLYILKGMITDMDDKPLEGATVRLKGNNLLVERADVNGIFIIIVDKNATLQVSMMGYKPEEIKVDGKTSLALKLILEDNVIEDVVITGYSKINQESITGAATTITRKQLEKFNNNNIFAVLQSLDPAFKVDEGVESGSNPNVIPEINIRGISNVGEYAVNAPLVIIDGFEASLETLYDLDVNRIETISILKDASTTILYGSRGGNGVIVVETRLPKDGKFTLTYDAKPSLTLVDLSDYSLMNSAEKLAYENLAGLYTSQLTDANTRPLEQQFLTNLYNQRLADVQSGVDTYWLSQPVQTTVSVAHSIRLEGGTDAVRYSLDGNYNNYLGAMKESGRERGGAGFNLIYRIPNKFSFRNYATYLYSKAKNSPYGSFSIYTQLNPYDKIYDANGDLNASYNDFDNYIFGSIMYNPLFNAQLPYLDYSRSNSITNNMDIEWFLNKEFRVTLRGYISRSFSSGQIYKSPYHSDFALELDPSYRGSLTEHG